MRVEEVLRRLNDLVADRGVEMADLHFHVVVGDFAVKLRHGETVLVRGVPVEVPRMVAEALRLRAVDAEQVIDPPAEIPAAALGVGLALGIEPSLVHREAVADAPQADGSVAGRAVLVGVNAAVEPAADGDVAVGSEIPAGAASRDRPICRRSTSDRGGLLLRRNRRPPAGYRFRTPPWPVTRNHRSSRTPSVEPPASGASGLVWAVAPPSINPTPHRQSDILRFSWMLVLRGKVRIAAFLLSAPALTRDLHERA